MATIIDENPVQGLFQGMWSGLVHFIVLVGNGVSVGGVTLFSFLVTVCIMLAIWFIVKIVKG